MARVVIVVFEAVQTLDATGPAEVFAAAGRLSGRAGYRVELAATGGGERSTSSGLRVIARDLRRVRPRRESCGCSVPTPQSGGRSSR